MDRLVRQRLRAGRRPAGGQVRQLRTTVRITVRPGRQRRARGQVQHAQPTVGEVQGAGARPVHALHRVAGEVGPTVPAQRGQHRRPGGGRAGQQPYPAQVGADRPQLLGDLRQRRLAGRLGQPDGEDPGRPGGRRPGPRAQQGAQARGVRADVPRRHGTVGGGRPGRATRRTVRPRAAAAWSAARSGTTTAAAAGRAPGVRGRPAPCTPARRRRPTASAGWRQACAASAPGPARRRWTPPHAARPAAPPRAAGRRRGPARAGRSGVRPSRSPRARPRASGSC